MAKPPLHSRRALPVFASAKDLLDDLGMTSPPVNARLVAESYGYRVEVEPSPKGYDCAILIPERTIMVDAKADDYRQRYAVAHSLGHAVLHPHVSTTFTDTFDRDARTPMENEAHAFAIELLVPRNWVLARIGTLSKQSLALSFGLPLPAMRQVLKMYGFS